MEKFKLSNGLQVINAGYLRDYAACLGFSIGDMNVPEKGLAYLFMRILLLQKSGVIPYFGGVSTAFGLSGDDIDEVLEKLCDVLNVEITEDYLRQAKAEINQLVFGTEMAIQQEMRFLFRRLAVGSEAALFDASAVECINSYGVDDVKAFMEKYCTASNAFLLIAGSDRSFYTLRSTVEKLFSQMKSGEKQVNFVKKAYCGGYQHINAFDGVNRLMLGWDLSKFSIEGNSTVLAMLQVFVKELKQAYIRHHLFNVDIDMRIVSFFGIRFMRILIYSKNASLYRLSDVVCETVKKLCLENYADNISFNRLSFASEGLSESVEFAEERLFAIFDNISGQIEQQSYDESNETLSGEDIKLAAYRFFLGSKLTCVSASLVNGDVGLEKKFNVFFQNLGKEL